MMVGFLVSTVGCGLSTSLGMLIGFRLLQGLALGPMEGISAVILVETFPPHQRGLALGLRTIGWSAGQVISFTIGGYFIQEISWRLIFFLGVPSGIIAAVPGLLMLPQRRESRSPSIDYLGSSLWEFSGTAPPGDQFRALRRHRPFDSDLAGPSGTCRLLAVIVQELVSPAPALTSACSASRRSAWSAARRSWTLSGSSARNS